MMMMRMMVILIVMVMMITMMIMVMMTARQAPLLIIFLHAHQTQSHLKQNNHDHHERITMMIMMTTMILEFPIISLFIHFHSTAILANGHIVIYMSIIIAPPYLIAERASITKLAKMGNISAITDFISSRQNLA